MIRRLLIANRGEIAIRIMRACHELGVETVAVYSEADESSRHVRFADQAVAIGPASSTHSYLNGAAVLRAAQMTGADAIHPGYGFLSQNPAFAAACEQAGIAFVGPPSRVIAEMGSKIESRRLMQAAGVPIVPGETPADQSDAGLGAAIDRIGLPALVKASAGGGGKGMRTVREPSEVADAVRGARREALAAFGDGTLYVEQLIDRPRHIEVQVFGDHHGNLVHLFERECSLQRRHQKVIEESPAPSISPALRDRMTDAAVRAARAVLYRNAGTVEFLVESPTSFYFLEMNTRLQVEHGVTELTAGVDLVRAQLLVASGEALPWTEDSLAQRGHAIEARVYAEDPSNGFLPQAGRLLLYREPTMPGIRVDAGVGEGDDVSVHYDPLLAKVVAWAETRDLAVARLASALRAYPILGVHTNVPFLLRILAHPAVRAGRADTGFLDRETRALFGGHEEAPRFVRAAMAVHTDPRPRRSAASWDPWAGPAIDPISRSRGHRTDPNAHQTDLVQPEGLAHEVDGRASPDFEEVRNGSRPTATEIDHGVYRVAHDGRVDIVYAAGPSHDRWAFWNGEVFHESTSARQPARADALQSLTSPMPATVRAVLAPPGTKVRKGDVVLILEAMKMELPLRAPADGVVSAVHCREGELVRPDVVLVELK